MKERFLESFAILLAGLFSAERPRPWRSPSEGGDLRPGEPSPRSNDAAPDELEAAQREKRTEN